MSRRIAFAFLVYFTLAILGSGEAKAIMAVPSQEGAQTTAKEAAPSQGAAVLEQTAETVSVRNVLVEKIDGNVLYAKDGSTYSLKDLTVVDNSRRGKVYVAELTYIGETLKRVMLK